MKASRANRFQGDAQRYAAYLQTPQGRLRLDLAWSNLKDLLPEPVASRQLNALDVGGGTGDMALRLASLGLRVTVLDESETMLEMAWSAATQAGFAGDIRILQGDASNLLRQLQPASFDVIVCHNVLEYLEDPKSILRSIRKLIRPSEGIVSIVVRNRSGEVLKDVIKSGDLGLAATNLSAEAVTESLYGGKARLFTPSDLREALAQGSFEAFAERGVRTIADYLSPEFFQDDAGYARVLVFERMLGTKPDFAAIARYTQIFARASREAHR